jgi:hypothetical protein
MFGTDWHLFGNLALTAFVALLVFVTGVIVYLGRVGRRPPVPMSEELGAKRAVLAKVRKREPMSPEEAEFATRIVADQRSLLIFCIPAAIFTMGCFYVLGSLEQLHGTTPSERTFIGVIPMFTSMNILIQILRIRRLKGRVPKVG